ncbi:hypothetical protein OPT61_g8396 [Boeremia exigua]|uniref:Uncharacterized protein n=1 Tax=Boeremia exigua TaxID=749465 RepID=A0ACC2HYS6_9PLEO|nr:hypothetical protein OPT61_g8396 [Boeremia exigua]
MTTPPPQCHHEPSQDTTPGASLTERLQPDTGGCEVTALHLHRTRAVHTAGEQESWSALFTVPKQNACGGALEMQEHGRAACNGRADLPADGVLLGPAALPSDGATWPNASCTSPPRRFSGWGRKVSSVVRQDTGFRSMSSAECKTVEPPNDGLCNSAGSNSLHKIQTRLEMIWHSSHAQSPLQRLFRYRYRYRYHDSDLGPGSPRSPARELCIPSMAESSAFDKRYAPAYRHLPRPAAISRRSAVLMQLAHLPPVHKLRRCVPAEPSAVAALRRPSAYADSMEKAAAYAVPKLAPPDRPLSFVEIRGAP